MEETIGAQILAKSAREKRIDQRMETVTWLGKEWQRFRLLQEAAMWRRPDQPIPIDRDLEQRYSLTAEDLLSLVRKMEQFGLVEVFASSDGQAHAFQITRDETSLAGQLIEALFR